MGNIQGEAHYNIQYLLYDPIKEGIHQMTEHSLQNRLMTLHTYTSYSNL